MPVNSNFTPGQVLTAAQLNAQFGAAAAQADLAQIQNGTATDAGALNGAETMPQSRGSGLLQTTLTKIASWIIQTYQGFTSSASGATAVTVSKALGLIPLYPEFFGALGTGADDTAALQAWLNALGSGAIGMLSPGKVYGFTNLTLPSPTPYTGAGVDQPRTFGMVIDGSNATLKMLSGGADPTYGIASTLYLSNSTSQSTPIKISNLILDFNGLATTAGLITQHWNSLFEKMTVFGAAGHGHMQTAVAKGGAAVTGLMNNNNWVGCDLFGNGGYGLYVNPGAGHNNTDGILDRVRAFDNKLANVNIQNCQGWDFANVHAWNFSVPQTDIAVSIYANTGPTKWRGCEFDNDTNNTALPCVDVTNGAGGSVGGVFVGGYAYSPVSLRNSSGSRTVYTATAFELNNSAYFYLNGSNIALLSTTGIYQSANPFQSLVNDGTNSATSSFDSWNAQGVLLNGRHTLTKGSVAPYIGGYAYQPLKGPTYNIAASGATYAMRYGDSLVQLFSTALTAAITIQLPPKANIANGQPPFEFQRQASATGAFNIVIQDVDTSSTIATLTTAGTYQKIIFDGFNWKTAGSGSL